MKKIILIMAMCFVPALFAHDEGHALPDTLPPIGPHGGKYTKLTRHFAEVTVSGNKATVYILERDIKSVAEDATNVGATLEIPGKGKTALSLTQDSTSLGYKATIFIPPGTRRVTFHIKCMLDGKWETGSLIFEPRK